MSVDEWLGTVALWARLWPNRPLPPESVEAWYDLLSDLDGPTVAAALRTWAADPERGWPPNSPGELRAAATAPDRDWTSAIGELATLVRRVGRTGGRPALDPVLDEYVTSMGGWTALCSRWDATNAATRAQFREFYTAAARRVRHDTARALAVAATPGLDPGGPAALPGGDR